MRNGFFLFLFSSFFFVSCQKEVSEELRDGNNNGGGGGNGSEELLVKMVIDLGGNDSSVTTYGYNTSDRWISEVQSGNFNLFTDEIEVAVTRNIDGSVERYLTVQEDGLGNIISTSYNVGYNPTTRRYEYKVSSKQIPSGVIKDSAVYSYDNEGRISGERYFVDQSGAGDYSELNKLEYTYDASGNLTLVRNSVYEGASNTYQPFSETSMEYDAKVNPMDMGNEALVLNRLFFASANNISKITEVDLNDPTQSIEINFTYTYNAASKPSTATIAVAGFSLPVTYRYQ